MPFDLSKNKWNCLIGEVFSLTIWSGFGLGECLSCRLLAWSYFGGYMWGRGFGWKFLKKLIKIGGLNLYLIFLFYASSEEVKPVDN